MSPWCSFSMTGSLSRTMRFRIHRGAAEIGGSCVEVESLGISLLLDLGLPLSADGPGPCLLPPVQSLRNGGEGRPLAIFLSHSHGDHMGLLGEAHADIPVYMGERTRRLLEAAAPFVRHVPSPALVRTYTDQVRVEMEPFTITPYLTDHSAFDAYGLLVESEGRRLLYSGDFRGHGRKADLVERFLRTPPNPIHTLLLEGTTLSRTDASCSPVTEAELEDQVVHDLELAPGLVLACFSAQNIDRFVTLYRATRRAGRRFIGDAYLGNILASLGLDTLPRPRRDGLRVYLGTRQRAQIVRAKRFDIVAPFRRARIFDKEIQETPNKWVMLFRESLIADIDRLGLLGQTTLIYAQWPGYLDQPQSTLGSWCLKHEISVIHRHTSGHADPALLRRYARALNPDKLVPIHTLIPDRYSTLFENVSVCPDGVWQAV
jgi:ribonuclease J